MSHVLQTSNGEVVVSADSKSETIGLLVCRSGLEVGTILTPTEAEELARLLLASDGLR
jgi:hypothetical protein